MRNKDFSSIQNYNLYMEQRIAQLQEEKQVPRLLLHSCCAPCSSATLERLMEYFHVTVFYYNPNIEPEEEYYKRVKEQQVLLGKLSGKYPVKMISGEYKPWDFYHKIKGLEHDKEGGRRCYSCYELRLTKTAELARQLQFDFFTTTLSISPMKNTKWLNEIGNRLSKEYGVEYLFSDFKKKNGYKRSIELSREYGLYRQDYCGCIFSKQERIEQKRVKTESMNLTKG